MHITRRQFIRSLAGAWALGAVPSLAMGATVRGGDAKARYLLAGCGNNICIVDTSQWERRHLIPLDFYPHSYVPRPLKPGRMWTFQRHKHDAANGYSIMKSENYISKAIEFDLLSGEVTQTITASKGSQFRGHGFFMPDSDTLFISRLEDATEAGFLTGYDVATGKQVADYRVTKSGIHECKLLPDGTAVIASAGKMSAKLDDGSTRDIRGYITHFDLQRGRTISVTPVDNTTHWVAHFWLQDDGRILALSGSGSGEDKDKLAGIYTGRLGEGWLKPVAIPGAADPGRYNEMFSVAVDEANHIAAVANHGDGHVYIIDADTHTYLQRLPFKGPGGVVFHPEQRSFIVNGAALGTWKFGAAGISELGGILPPMPETLAQSHSLLTDHYA